MSRPSAKDPQPCRLIGPPGSLWAAEITRLHAEYVGAMTQHPPEIDRYIRRELPNLSGKRILDVGCGRGGMGYLLRTHSGGATAHIVGVDVYAPYLDFSRRFALYD